MMQRLVDRILPDEGILRRREADGYDEPRHRSGTTTVIDGTPIDQLLGPRNVSPTTLTSRSSTWSYDSLGGSVLGTNKEELLSKQLHALFPSQDDIDLITGSSPGTEWITTMLAATVTGRIESPAARIPIPHITNPPAVLARSLLQFAICIQHLSPQDTKSLALTFPVADTMLNIVSTVSNTIISNDDMIGSIEGLQCAILHGHWLLNAGNLRKAWLIFRRALSVAQLIGVGPGNVASASWDGRESHNTHSPASVNRAWYLIVSADRYFSLLLGLRIDMRDDSFASEEAMKDDGPDERLEKIHSVISARISDRNLQDPHQAFLTTQAIDYDLDAAAKRLGHAWWADPTSMPSEFTYQRFERLKRLMRHICHYSLVNVLHLPYLLREPAEHRYSYSRATCIRSSREVLGRFIAFRTDVESVSACRHIDYSGSIAAMTLLLSYLVRGQSLPGKTSGSEDKREEDRVLVGRVKERMEQVAMLNQDKLSQESARIIGQLLPVLAVDGPERVALATGAESDTVQLDIPYLGVVRICVNPKQGQGTLQISDLRHAEERSSLQEPGIPQQFGPSGLELDGQVENMFIHVEPHSLGDHPEFPSLTAEASDWPFQGVDTNFWSLLHGGLGRESDDGEGMY
ncbi:hypothetical protein BO70DRAFT_357407 [Aspergillus heteromorphus CBS 117.55]|uniref:Transcription factor domain-containing protein n=1 Tax=Aspergillus heteromorphus CBS 117.55 TaxID=1448321 RepID=A0A317X0U7_9EURO|nr:uncharacterized protein BO70DRAFT_357407 [Aspergillus heteromorphus CBS 117.55]PWY92274.1 hypothetical protein BO70DRAFT_357407 [Aspergillus heteromorphus CBS 117.55]